MKRGTSVYGCRISMSFVLVPYTLYDYDSHTYISSIDLQTLYPDAYV